MDTLQTITEKLKTASLPQNQMILWDSVLGDLSESSLKDILDFLNSDNNAINILTTNILAKEEAFKSGNLEQWEKVLQDDINIVKSM